MIILLCSSVVILGYLLNCYKICGRKFRLQNIKFTIIKFKIKRLQKLILIVFDCFIDSSYLHSAHNSAKSRSNITASPRMVWILYEIVSVMVGVVRVLVIFISHSAYLTSIIQHLFDYFFVSYFAIFYVLFQETNIFLVLPWLL